jgi:FMN reductase
MTGRAFFWPAGDVRLDVFLLQPTLVHPAKRKSMSASVSPLILGIGGTPRAGSSSEKALAISLRAAAAEGGETIMIGGTGLMLPMYNPGLEERTPEALFLLDSIRRADGLIIASPAYHGSLSGLIKNALDYTEDLRADERVYLNGMAIGLIVCAGGWQAAGQTLGALRDIVHALRGWPTPLGATLNTSTRLFDETGECLDLSSKFQLEEVGRQVCDFARMKINRRLHASGQALPATLR